MRKSRVETVRRGLCVLLVCCMLLGLVPMAGAAPIEVSTEAELRAAILAAPANIPTTITVNNTINITGNFTGIPIYGGRNIIINGTGTLTVASNIRHILLYGVDTTLTLAGDITLTRAAGYSGNGGGIAVSGESNDFPRNTTLIMRENAAIINNRRTNGGGVGLEGGTLHMHDNSRIEYNQAIQSAGGVSAQSLGSNGVYMWDNSSISYNTAPFGGGITFGSIDALTMHGGRINGNTATYDGGGIEIMGRSRYLQMFAGEIRNNTAGRNGGGIYVAPHAYGSLAIHAPMIFNGNTAGSAHDYGLAAGLSNWPFIRWTGENSIPGTHLLNNYDINFTGQAITVLRVIFDGNGGTVLPENQIRTVAPDGRLGANMPPDPTHPQGANFLGWTRNQDGTGGWFTSTTIVNENITVYAQWDDEEVVLAIEITNAPAVLRRNASVTLDAVVTPAAAPQDLIWTSSNPTLATVSADGVVHARSATGTVVITARSAIDGTVHASVTIRLSA